MNFDDTIAAPATIPGTGAITVIRISGKDSFAIADRVVSFAGGKRALDAPGYSILYGTVPLRSSSLPLDDVLVSVFRAPHSYTGEDSVEISTHASSYIASTLMQLLCDAGARVALPGEFTRRAFVNGKMDLAQAEGVADLIASQSASAHHLAMHQLKGHLSDELSRMRAELLDMASLLELELDFSEEDVEFAGRAQLNSLLDSVLAHIGRLTSSFRTGRAIKEGIPVAIVGNVNAGKSTLLNALLQDDRAIVSDIPGTTRDTVEELLDIDGILFRLIDTAGLRETSESIEKQGIQRSRKKIAEADVVLEVVDSTLDEESIEKQISNIVSMLDFTKQELFILFNKFDLKAGFNLLNNDNNKNVIDVNSFVFLSDNQRKHIKVLKISAKEGIGVDELKKILSSSRKKLVENSEETIVSNARHYDALSKAGVCLERVKQDLAQGIGTELVAEDLRETLGHLEDITKPISNYELLGNIFSRFCIGK